MADENTHAGASIYHALVRRADETRVGFDPENILFRLTVADYVSLVALLCAWVSALLFVAGEPNWAILAMFGSFFFDKLDGYVARSLSLSSSLGRQVDSFIDVFAYLVPAALLYHVTMAPNLAVSAVVGFVVIAFGGLRLIRHVNEGFGDEDGTSYYHGTTVVHTNLVVVANYLLWSLVPAWNGWLAGAVVVAVSPLMVSEWRSYKTARIHWIAGALVVVMAALALALEPGV